MSSRNRDKRRGKKVSKSKRSHGSKVRKSKDSLTVPSLGAKMEELNISKAEIPKFAVSAQQGCMEEKSKRAANNMKAIESLFKSLCDDEEVLVFTSSDPAYAGCYHDCSEDDSDDDSSSHGCHKVEEWIPVDRYVWRPRPQIDPKWGPCIAANPRDN